MSSLAFVPSWQGDETLYSWCARFHQVCGNGSARRTSSVLFGGEHAVRERDAPMHLRHFVDATHGALGSVESILRTRTATGLYWPFLHPHRREQIRTYFEGTSGSGWVTRIGMPASAIAARDLRYCDECVLKDVSAIGIARWRLAHQLICAHVCLDHGNPLRTLKVKASTWLLPPAAKAAMGATEEVAWSPVVGRILQRLAHLAWACIGVDAIELDLVRSAALHGLRTAGVASWQFPVDGARLARWFRGTDLARAMRDAQPSQSRIADGLWVHALLRRRREEHPVLWLMLWCAIHPEHSLGALTSGFLAPAASTEIWDERGQGCFWSAPRFALPPNVMELILSHGSLKCAAKALGISVVTLRRHLELEGCRGGQFIAEAHASQRRHEALEAIRQYVTQHPGCSRTAIHRDCKAAVAWLGRYAKEDLVQLLATIPERRPRQLDLLRSTSGPMDPKV
ncbi:TniQ family protein [Thiomonas sp. FB-6]|uniref:TniQ family protein n=1 Tax=Thiomonas sp. FB-6 TaxID=1158291 RepID=UPI00037E9EF4|nr:TniQ family protein [Thiomonas sp. FB-6]